MKCDMCGAETTDSYDFGGQKVCEDCYFKKEALKEEPHKCGER
ncbi:MAG: hypothetical protein SVY15_05085 [Halobacteriota archaeon]|nr:hypothetical protein [Halobacteriota archaeon]